VGGEHGGGNTTGFLALRGGANGPGEPRGGGNARGGAGYVFLRGDQANKNHPTPGFFPIHKGGGSLEMGFNPGAGWFGKKGGLAGEKKTKRALGLLSGPLLLRRCGGRCQGQAAASVCLDCLGFSRGAGGHPGGGGEGRPFSKGEKTQKTRGKNVGSSQRGILREEKGKGGEKKGGRGGGGSGRGRRKRAIRPWAARRRGVGKKTWGPGEAGGEASPGFFQRGVGGPGPKGAPINPDSAGGEGGGGRQRAGATTGSPAGISEIFFFS